MFLSGWALAQQQVNKKSVSRARIKFLPALYTAYKETSFPSDHSRSEPPESISNSEVKRTRADDSVGFPHVKVGHRQGFFKIKK